MSPSVPVDLHIRSYGRSRDPDRHAFAQLVLPLSGSLSLEIAGKQGKLDVSRAAFVEPNAWHSQYGDGPNRSIILDIELASIAPRICERLVDRPFAPVSPASRKLIEFMALMSEQQGAAASMVHSWVPLLLDSLTLETPRPASRLAVLLARIEAQPGLPWTTESMAKSAGMSVSRLHALFRAELDASPHQWLLEHRLRRVCEWLAHTDRPIAELALNAGFSDQSALTRAMRKSIQATPAAYRRQSRENWPK